MKKFIEHEKPKNLIDFDAVNFLYNTHKNLESLIVGDDRFQLEMIRINYSHLLNKLNNQEHQKKF